MPSIHFQPPPPSDPFGEALHMLRLTGTLYCRATLSAPWGIAMPEMIDSITFVIVTSGRGWVELDGELTEVGQGSMVLLPSGRSFRLLSSPDAAAEPLFDLPVEKVSDRYEIMVHGGGGEITRATSGVVQFDNVTGRRLVSQLPRLLKIDAWDDTLGSWIQSTIALISREASALKPGGETVMTRLADILVIQAIRAWLDTAPEAQTGWLAALRDRQLGRALALIHRQPEHDWSLASLAQAAGMSRSAFAARFSAALGQPAMQYLTHWRMNLARAQLIDTAEPVRRIAEQVGYQSEAAFCRAFKQIFGQSPGTLRRLAA